MRKEIRHAYDNIHVSKEMSERLKQKLYQKDFSEEEDFFEASEPEEISGRQPGKYLGFIAASLVLCAGIGFSMHTMMEHRNDQILNPQSTVSPSEIPVTEATEESTEFSAPDA